MEVTLALYRGQDVLFSSSGKWLHPLFELEEFLASSGLDPAGLRVRDKIVGKAAALLLIRLGLRQVDAGVLSSRARGVLDRHAVLYSFETLVQSIACRTEEILKEIDDPEEAYAITRGLADQGLRKS
jgi:hypothetical protein